MFDSNTTRVIQASFAAEPVETSKLTEVLHRQHVAVRISVLHGQDAGPAHQGSLPLSLSDDCSHVLVALASGSSCSGAAWSLIYSKQATAGKAWSLAARCPAPTVGWPAPGRACCYKLIRSGSTNDSQQEQATVLREFASQCTNLYPQIFGRMYLCGAVGGFRGVCCFRPLLFAAVLLPDAPRAAALASEADAA